MKWCDKYQGADTGFVKRGRCVSKFVKRGTEWLIPGSAPECSDVNTPYHTLLSTKDITIIDNYAYW